MASIRLNWANLNSQRSFPIEERASKLSDAGVRLPDNALTSAKIRFPSTLGTRACVSGIAVGPGLATVTFVTTTDAFADPVPLACVSVSSPDPGRPYAITPMYPGVSGWVSFGTGIDDYTALRSWKFSDPSQSPIIPSEAYSYPELPISFVGKWNLLSKLMGLVSLIGDGPVIIEGADVDLGSGLERVIRFKMDRTLDPTVLYTFAGPCADRPESRTCDFTAITSINAVTPDCLGDITLSFADPFVATEEVGYPYIAVDFPVGMDDACDILKELTRPQPDGTIPGAGEDNCGETDFYPVT